ncbi:hypothetical protein CGLO_10193 [Colletotrichum gloeosporioides Cg-14]|uniref:Uncharacterized protein n=1 Tax=Colletotrichum gloeosporioides (strain Cg-14) TaxID=1237896 RepID=T0K3U1_COLGC|nr:hypothetical protein CGLO_10193 [Colletotrichum gloeosporioides Cg-14]
MSRSFIKIDGRSQPSILRDNTDYYEIA